IFSFLTLSKLRIGHSYLNQNTLQFNFLKNKTIKEDPILHCVEENVKLLELFGIDTKDVPIPKLSIYIDEKMKLEGEEYIKDKNRVKVGLHPGSSRFKNHKYRRWKKENFVKLIRHFKDFDFYVFGSKEEEDEVYYITSNTTNSVPIVDIDILNVIKIVSNMDLFVSNDSGLMHLANALNVPTIGIFGPTNPVWVRPWNEPYKVVRLNLDCSPCFVYSPKPLECKIKDKYKCLNELDESLVIDAVKELLQDVS
ncbi:MAG: glycosyltransferase family 9 protein, partial [Hydrogenothermaceae bacterium]